MSTPYDCARLVPSPWADLFDHPEEHIAALAEDIKLRGIQTPLQVYPLDSNRLRAELLTGHDRLEAAKRLGMKQVPVEFRSTLTDEDARFRHFIADNTQRKGVDKRRIARAVLLRAKGDISDREVARLVRCDHHTTGDVRTELLATGEIPQLEKTTGADGKARTTKPERAPRVPKVADLTTFRDRPKKADRSEQLRQQREEQAPEASPYFEETKPIGVDVPAKMAEFHEERKADPFLRLQAFICDLPIPPSVSDADVAMAVPRIHAGLVKQARDAHDLLARVLSHFSTSEVRSA